MTAIIWCDEVEVLALHEQPIPRIGELIVVERDERKTYLVNSVLWSYRFIKTGDCPITDHRIEIHVSQVSQVSR